MAPILQHCVRRRHSLSLLLALLLALLSGAPGVTAVSQGSSLGVELCAQDFLAVSPALRNAETRQAMSPTLPLAIPGGASTQEADASTAQALALGAVPVAIRRALHPRFGRAPPRWIPS